MTDTGNALGGLIGLGIGLAVIDRISDRRRYYPRRRKPRRRKLKR